MYIEEQIRNLAKSEYWQTLWRASKESNSVDLFNNKSNFSGLQLLFIHYLQVYAMLYEELQNKEWPNLYEETINDHTHCDAFLYYRSREINRKITEYKKEERSLGRKQGKKFDKEQSFKVFKGPKNKVNSGK